MSDTSGPAVRKSQEIRRIIDTLIDVLDDPKLRELRRDMATWLRRAVLPARLPEIEVPELNDLQEAKIMLAERAATWPRQWMAEGFEEGHAKGQAKGLREALISLAAEKFGSLDALHAELIDEASEAQLRLWLKRILSVEDAAKLFNS